MGIYMLLAVGVGFSCTLCTLCAFGLPIGLWLFLNYVKVQENVCLNIIQVFF